MSDAEIALRARIVASRAHGSSYEQIAAEFGISKSKAHRWCTRFEADASLHDKPRSGRPRLVTAQVATRIMEIMQLTNSLRETQKALSREAIVISRGAIQICNRRLLDRKSVRKKPLLSPKQMSARLQFAQANLRRPLAFWRNVLFTDEKLYVTFRRPKHVYVLKGSPAPIVPAVKCPPKIQLWGGISYFGTTSLYRLHGKQTSALYIQRLEENLQNEAARLFRGRWVYMHDSTSYGVHGSKATRKWLGDNVLFIDPWPANSPDLNPIEHVWSWLSREVGKLNPKSVEEYWSALDETWRSMDPSLFRNLVDSMPRRLRAVVRANGGNTEY